MELDTGEIGVVGLFGDAAQLSEAAVFARTQHAAMLLFEGAGLFWLLAEMAILLLVLSGRRHVSSEPLPDRFAPTAHEIRRGAAWLGAFVVLTAVVWGRHVWLPPVYVTLQRAAETGGTVAADALTRQYTVRLHTHLAIWSGFVTLWVVFETLIVYHGWRGYRRLRVVLGAEENAGHGPGRRGVAVAMVMVCAGLSLAAWRATADEGTALGVLRAAEARNVVHRNAVYLYLRLAGAVWILVEWIAALVLWRTYRLVSAAVAQRGRMA
ncbi:MAG: hypothetical protein GWP08_00040 [Nitrospiraceae bacterium]|nr:hypothetical protein [Nitrospiraceae bacterium]